MTYQQDFHMTLPSNASLELYPDNSLASYRTKLPERVDLDGDNWEVGLSEIQYARTWFNVERGEMMEVEFGHRSFINFPFFVPKFDLPFQEQVAHLLEFLNTELEHNLDGVIKFVRGGDRIVRLVDVMSANTKVVVSRSLAEFLNWKPLASGPYVDLGKWNEGKLTAFDLDKNDGKWFVSVTVSLPVTQLPVPPGYYPTPEILIEHLNKLLEFNIPEGRRFYFTYNPLVKRITLNVPPPFHKNLSNRTRQPEIFAARLNAPLAGMLGFENPGRLYGDEAVTAEHALQIHAGLTTIFVHCDIVRPSVVGNVLAPLLRAVQISGKDGDFVNEIFTVPYYRQLLRRGFESVHIYLTDDVGEIIPFQSGRVSVTLHFRKRFG